MYIYINGGVIGKMHRVSWRTENKMKTGFIRGMTPIFIHIEKQVEKAKDNYRVSSAILFNHLYKCL